MKKSMMIVACTWQEKPSFKLISISKDAPYNEIMYDPTERVLAIISKEFKGKPHLLPKLRGSGKAMFTKDIDEKGEKIQVPQYERVIMDIYYEYYIEDKRDMKALINILAINPEHKMLELMDKKEVKTKPKAKK